MRVNTDSLLFENLSSSDISDLRILEEKIAKGDAPFDNLFVQEWMKALASGEVPDTRATHVLHIRILQSINAWMWERFGEQVYRFR